MFAVPGWSVSAVNLKTETEGSTTAGNGEQPPRKSNKRKRSGRPGDVTRDNVADLWHKLIERKKDSSSDVKKKQKHEHKRESPVGGSSESKQATADDEWNGFEDEGESEQQPAVKHKKKSKKERDVKGSIEEPEINSEAKKSKSKDAVKPLETPKTATTPKLTPLQASMREKLVSARFRHLNETLYTRPSDEAYRLFADSPEMFEQYHEGFRRQVAVWPENPVDGYISEVLARGRIKQYRSHHQDRRPSSAPGALLPLMRTDGGCTIADLGCGDAALAAGLQPHLRKLRLTIHSFDLQSASPLVTRADAANLPLADGTVDVAVCCLALMGTNWVDFIEEAYRILHWKGELWVAEIKSRFALPRGAKKGGRAGAVVEHSVGRRKKGPAAAEDEEKEAKDLAVEVDGEDDRRGETDVSAFVEVLRRRGFILRGEPAGAIDLSNKMFVKMYFVKAAAPTRGKGVAAAAAWSRDGMSSRPAKKKFITKDEEGDGIVDEAAVLKPCVYKLR
jgi:ribosomal RNA-processing protein 8